MFKILISTVLLLSTVICQETVLKKLWEINDTSNVFFSICNLTVEPETENIFVLDRSAYRIVKLDKSGKVIKTAGRRGEGPGELGDYLFNCTLCGDKLYVSEGMTVHVFDKDLNFEHKILIKNHLSQIFFKNNLGYGFAMHNPGGPVFKTFDSDIKNLQKHKIKKIHDKVAYYNSFKVTANSNNKLYVYYKRYNIIQTYKKNGKLVSENCLEGLPKMVEVIKGRNPSVQWLEKDMSEFFSTYSKKNIINTMQIDEKNLLYIQEGKAGNIKKVRIYNENFIPKGYFYLSDKEKLLYVFNNTVFTIKEDMHLIKYKLLTCLEE